MMDLGRILRLASVAALGVFAGAMLTEGGVLVPWWRTMPPAEFFAWYAANDHRLVGFFGPLTVVAVLLPLAAAGVSLWRGHPGRWFAVAAAALGVVVLSMFFVYFEAANASFSAASVAPQDLPAELARWAGWHRVRTVLSLVALAAGTLAL